MVFREGLIMVFRDGKAVVCLYMVRLWCVQRRLFSAMVCFMVCLWADQRQFLLRLHLSLSPWVAWEMAVPVVSEGYCQCATPAYQPSSSQAWTAQLPRSVCATQPVLVASVVRMGLATTSLLQGMPLALTSLMAVPLKSAPVAWMKSSLQESYLESTWLQHCSMQKSMRSPTLSLTVLQPPWTQYSFLKQGVCGQWLRMWFGITARTACVNFISQSQPVPRFIAWLSSQSTSPPSRLLSRMNCPNFVPHATGSYPADVGNSLSPNALTVILMPLSWQIWRILVWMSLVVLPKELGQSKQVLALAQIMAISLGLPAQLQNARMIMLQSCLAANPGTPRPFAMLSPYHDEVRSMQAARIGQLNFPFPATAFCFIFHPCPKISSSITSNTFLYITNRLIIILTLILNTLHLYYCCLSANTYHRISGKWV